MQVLRNAGSRVKLMVARDITKDSQIYSPAINLENLDCNVSVCLCPEHLKYNRLKILLYVFSLFQVNKPNGDYEFSVDFTKNSHGLGFTISTYIGNLNSGNDPQYNRLININVERNSHILYGVRKLVGMQGCIVYLSQTDVCMILTILCLNLTHLYVNKNVIQKM